MADQASAMSSRSRTGGAGRTGCNHGSREPLTNPRQKPDTGERPDAAVSCHLWTASILSEGLRIKRSLNSRFGTGYSSMALLRSLHIDVTKIDRTAVNDLESDPGRRDRWDHHHAGSVVVAAVGRGRHRADRTGPTAARDGMRRIPGLFFLARPLPAKDSEIDLTQPA